jgi:hypothetical protein
LARGPDIIPSRLFFKVEAKVPLAFGVILDSESVLNPNEAYLKHAFVCRLRICLVKGDVARWRHYRKVSGA